MATSRWEDTTFPNTDKMFFQFCCDYKMIKLIPLHFPRWRWRQPKLWMSAAAGRDWVRRHCCRVTTRWWKCAIKGLRTSTNSPSCISLLATWPSCARWWRSVNDYNVTSCVRLRDGASHVKCCTVSLSSVFSLCSWDQKGHERSLPGRTLPGRCQRESPHLEELWTEWVLKSIFHLLYSHFNLIIQRFCYPL